jgi:hypothetical protein
VGYDSSHFGACLPDYATTFQRRPQSVYAEVMASFHLLVIKTTIF